MKTKCLIIAAALAALRLHAADTNTVATTTNTVAAASWFREVDGKLYNTRLSQKFVYIHGNIASVHDGFVVVTRDQSQTLIDIAVVNYDTLQTGIAEGQLFQCSCMKIGTTNFDGRTLELWDCGKPHLVKVVKTNAP